VRAIGSASGAHISGAQSSGVHPTAGNGSRATGTIPPASGPAIPIPDSVATASAVTPPPTPIPAEGEHLVRRLKVIDGADQGHSFLIANSGVITVGSSSKHADVCLHDLYVARVHCQLEVEDDHLLVTSCEASRPTYINGQPVQQHALVPGDVLRVGNSYLRLELEVADSTASARSAPGMPAAMHAPAKMPRLPLNRLSELVGMTLGHFELEKALGTGHHGVVFRARDLKTEQDVALKVFAPDFPANDAEMQQFIQAMRGALPLRHASLVTIHGAGKSGPYCWLSRELVSGVSLAQMIHPSGKTREGIDWRLALRVAVHVAQALDAVHRQRLSHRNVTPNNILVEGKEGQVKLNDLMLGTAFEGTVLGESVRESKFLAELPYLAPEQIEPDAFVDDLCDLYSLGVAVYALMTGRLPFRGKTPEDTLQQIRESIPTKPKKLERSIPTQFQEVVLKMLAKRQEDRYATPTELLADLDEIARVKNVPV
jgi:hypothetical protein